MKTRLQRQRTATPESAQGNRSGQTSHLAVQPQTAESSPQPIDLQMQRATEMGHSLGNFTVQPALAVGEPGDKYEQEADEIAGQAVQMKPQAGAAAGAPNDNAGRATHPNLTVQRQPDLDLGGSTPDLGGMGDLAGGDLGGMGDAMGGMDELAGGAGGGDLGGMADALGGDGGGDLGDMGDAMGDLGELGGETLTEALPDSPQAMDQSEEMEPEDGEDPTDMLEVGEIMEDSGIGDSLGDDGIEGGIRKEIAAGGQPLPEDIQEMLSSRLGMANPEDIRIHDNGVANDLCDQMGALAFTTGNHIFFAAGEYDPDSSDGQELIFHEAVHTIQQGAIDGSDGAAEEEAETNEAVAMQEDDTAPGDTETGDTENATNTETETPEGEDTSQAETTAEGELDQGEDNTADAAAEVSDQAETPPEVIGGIKGFVGKAPPATEPEAVTPPAGLSSPITPTESGSPEESSDDSAGEAADLMGGGGGESAFDLAIGEVMTFAGEPGADILNLQAATEYDTASGQIKSDNAAGEWITNNMILANTTSKSMEIYNRWGAVDDLPGYHKYNPLYYAALALETIIMVLEIVSGILDVISLFLLGITVALYILAGIFYGLGLLLNFIWPGAGAWAIGWATAIAQFTNATFPPIFNLLDTWLVILALMRIPLRIILMGLWLLEGITSAIFLAIKGAVTGEGTDPWAAMKDGLSLAGNQVIGLAGDLLEVAMFNMTSQADNIGGDELLSIANPRNIGKTAGDLGNDFVSAGKKAYDPGGSPTFKIVELRDATGADVWKNFDSSVDLGSNSSVKNAINWGDEGVKEIVKETGIDSAEAFAGGGIEFGQDAYKGETAANSTIYGAEGKRHNKDWNQTQLAAVQANSLLQQKLIQQEADDGDTEDSNDNELQANYESTISELPELELAEGNIEDSAANDVAGAIQAGTIAQVGIIQLEFLAQLKEEQLEAMYYGQLVLADQAAFAETSEDLSTESLGQDQEAEGMLDSSSGDVQEAQGDAGDMSGFSQTMSSIFGPLMGATSAFTPADSSGSQAAVDQSVDMGSTGEDAASQMPGNTADSGKQLDESKKEKEGIIADAQQSQKNIGQGNQEIINNQALLEEDLAGIHDSLDELYGLKDESEAAKEGAADEHQGEMEETSSWAEETLAIISEFWESNAPDDDEESDDEEADDEEETPSWDEMRELFLSLSLLVSSEAQASAGG